MDELSDARFMTVRIILRRYYNEAIEIIEQEDEGEMTVQQSERALMQLDDKYANEIVSVLSAGGPSQEGTNIV